MIEPTLLRVFCCARCQRVRTLGQHDLGLPNAWEYRHAPDRTSVPLCAECLADLERFWAGHMVHFGPADNVRDLVPDSEKLPPSGRETE